MKYFLVTILFFLTTVSVFSQEKNLEYYLENAKKNSPLINKNLNDNKIVELDLKQVKAVLYMPEINVDAAVLFAPIISHDNNMNKFEWVSSGASNYTGYDMAMTDGGQYQAFVSVNQPIFTSASFQNYADKANVLRQQNENSTILTTHELEQLVGYQYILCLKSKLQAGNSKKMMDELDSRLQIMQTLVDHAIYKQTDLMLMQIELQNREIELKNFQSEYKTNLFDLNLICGITDTTIVDIPEVDFQIKPETSGQSKFLTSFELDSMNIASDLAIFKNKYIPKVNLFANTGLNAVYVPAFNRLGFSTGLTFSWNIFDGSQRKIEYQKSSAGIETIQFAKSNFISRQEINKNKILSQIRSLNEREILYENQINQYNRLLEAYQAQLSQGDVSVMDLKNLMRDKIAKMQENILVKMEIQVLINSYNYWNF